MRFCSKNFQQNIELLQVTVHLQTFNLPLTSDWLKNIQVFEFDKHLLTFLFYRFNIIKIIFKFLIYPKFLYFINHLLHLLFLFSWVVFNILRFLVIFIWKKKDLKLLNNYTPSLDSVSIILKKWKSIFLKLYLHTPSEN